MRCAVCSVQFSKQCKINQVNCAICCLNWFTTLTVFICLNNHCCCGCCGIASPQPLFVYLDLFAAIFDEKNITDIIIIHNLGNILEERNCLHARAKKKHTNSFGQQNIVILANHSPIFGRAICLTYVITVLICIFICHCIGHCSIIERLWKATAARLKSTQFRSFLMQFR